MTMQAYPDVYVASVSLEANYNQVGGWPRHDWQLGGDPVLVSASIAQPAHLATSEVGRGGAGRRWWAYRFGMDTAVRMA